MRLRPVLLMAAMLVAGCGAPASSTAEPSGSNGRPFATAAVATFDKPWAIDFLPGSTRALVTEKPGRIWLVDVATGRKQAVAGAPRVVESSQGGLLDIKVSPQFGTDKLVYLTYSEPSPNGGSGLALARAELSSATGDMALDRLTVLWRDPAGGQGGQFGARIAFAPDGKSIFLSSGERQRFTPAQDRSEPLGKILHLTLDGKPSPDNPWAGRLGDATVQLTNPPEDTEAAAVARARAFNWPGPNLTPAETWVLGLRNPLGLAFAPDGRLWEVEMGPRGGDELNLIVKGRNYGYPLVSNGINYNGLEIRHHSAGDGFEPPKLSWTPVISPGGLLIYGGDAFPQWKGDALIAALSGQALVRVDLYGDRARKAEVWDMGKRIRAVAQGPGGAVYLLEDGPGARLLRLTPVRCPGG